MLKIARILGLLSIVLIIVGIILRNPIIVFSKNENLKIMPSSALLKKHVKFMVNTKLFRNYSNTEALDQVAAYIEAEFKKNCPDTKLQNFEVNGKNYKNIICFFKGKSQKRIVLGAHYDVADDQDGADDNASGVAGMIELTRILNENKSKINHDLEIVAYALEEPPYFRTLKMGSYIHAKSINDKNIEIAFMLSVEMIGYFSDDWLSQNYPTPLMYLYYPNIGNFITLISGTKEYWRSRQIKKSFSRSMNTPLFSLNAPDFIPGIDFSDHLNYWKFGYDAYMLTDTSFYRNPNYHKTSDTIETLDFDKIADIVRGLHGLVISKF